MRLYLKKNELQLTDFLIDLHLLYLNSLRILNLIFCSSKKFSSYG